MDNNKISDKAYSRAKELCGKHFTCTGKENEEKGFVGRFKIREDYDKGGKVKDNEGYGSVGIRGLGMCGNPDTKWPLTHILEETDEYIIACCDAGCGTFILKNPPRKKKLGKKKDKKKEKKKPKKVKK